MDDRMPAEFNAERAQFYPSNDLAYAWFKDRVIEVLTTWQDADIKDINDCIEVHECKRTIEVHEHIFPESQIDVLHSRHVLFLDLPASMHRFS